MSKNTKTILIIAVICLAVAGLTILSTLSDQIPPNDDYLVGNTGGNLLNGGLFCEAGGKVYFANAFDGGRLYVMNSDESAVTRLLNNSRIFSLNVGGDYLYYCLDNTPASGTGLGYLRPALGLYRNKTDGSEGTRLKSAPIITATLAGNRLYYQNYDNEKFTRLFSITTAGTEDGEVTDYIINPSSVYAGIIYFAGTQDDHYLRTLDTATETISVLLESNTYNPVYADGYLYYLDQSDNYRLCRYLPGENRIELLTEDRVDTYNIGGGLIYYQKNSADAPALIRMNTDGTNPEIIAAGNYSHINMTSQYVYFYPFGNETTIYHTPLYGPPAVNVFEAAVP